jgi:hypothetical protein
MEPNFKEPFIKLNSIKESLQKKDIYPALEWAKENRTVLENQVNIIFY